MEFLSCFDLFLFYLSVVSFYFDFVLLYDTHECGLFFFFFPSSLSSSFFFFLSTA